MRAIRAVSPWSVGSGARLQELITLPRWLKITGTALSLACTFLVWCAIHYVLSGVVVMFIAGWVQFGAWWAGLMCAPIVPVAYWSCKILFILRVSEAGTVAGVLQGMWRGRGVTKAWPIVMNQLKLVSRDHHAIVPPLHHVLPTASGVKATVVTGAISMDSAKLVKLEPEIASGMFCDRVLVRSLTPSLASIRFDWGQHLRQMYGLHDLPPAPVTREGQPARIRFGVNADGNAATLVSNLSTLIGGTSGGGKSFTVWAIIAGYLEQVPLRIRVVDPFGIDFAELGKRVGDGLVHDYVSDPKLPGARKMEDFWGDLETDFNRRMESVSKSGQRWHIPTRQEPLDLLIIDELLPVAPELKKEAAGHIVGRIAYSGRKAGFAAIALTQATQVDAIGRVRDLFPQRLCHRTLNRFVTEAVLGDSAESDGARCSHLDVDNDKGVGYAAADGARGYVGYRSAFVPNSEIAQLAQGLRPVQTLQDSSLRSKPTSLYAFHDNQGELLYVGIAEAERVETRWSEHARSKKWWCDVDPKHGKKVVGTFPDRETAETAEAMAIKKHHPKYNKQHNN